MEQERHQTRSQLFTVRLWSEALGHGQHEWRGQVRHVTSGETRYFRDWSTLVAFVQELLPELDGPSSTDLD
jgi:hypothetical protein